MNSTRALQRPLAETSASLSGSEALALIYFGAFRAGPPLRAAFKSSAQQPPPGRLSAAGREALPGQRHGPARPTGTGEDAVRRRSRAPGHGTCRTRTVPRPRGGGAGRAGSVAAPGCRAQPAPQCPQAHLAAGASLK